MQDEWFAKGCKTSFRAGRWLEGRTFAGTFTSTTQMGLFVSIQAATKLSSAQQEERDQIQEEFRL